jgi:hypothetical protein
MLCKPLDENADSSIRCNFDPVANISDLDEPQYEKHDLHKISRLARIVMLYKSLDKKRRFFNSVQSD